MSETVYQGTHTDPTAGTKPEKTFTQAQLNEIVADRLAKEKGKYSDYEAMKAKAEELDRLKEAGKSALEKAQSQAADLKAQLEALQAEAKARDARDKARDARDKVSAETGIPAALLTGDTEEACKAHAEALLKWRGGGGTPNRGVDHLLGAKPGGRETETEAAFAELRDGLFKST